MNQHHRTTDSTGHSPVPSGSCYVDTSFVTTAIFALLAHHAASHRFARQLFADGTTIYFSELLRLEYAQALRRSRDNLDLDTQRQFNLLQWDRIGVRERWMNYGFTLFEAFIGQFGWVEIGLTRQIIERSRQIMVTCNLESYDAAHVASALHSPPSIATTLVRITCCRFI